MEKFNVYISSMPRSNNAKVDYSVIFEKDEIVWYRFARKTIDKYKISSNIGYIEGVKLALKFAQEHNLYIVIFSSRSIVNPATLKGMLMNKQSKLFGKCYDTFFNDYIDFVNKCSKMHEFKIIKPSENYYYKYGIKIAQDKFISGKEWRNTK